MASSRRPSKCPPGKLSATFSVEAIATVADSTDVELTATLTGGGSTASLPVTIEPFLQGVYLEYASVFGPKKMMAEVEVFEPPAVRTAIAISDDSSYAGMTPYVFVEAGCGCSEPFMIYTFPVNSDQLVNVTATYGTNTATASFDILKPQLIAFQVDPNVIRAGDYALILARFQGPVSGSKTIEVTSSHPSIIPDTEMWIEDGRSSGWNFFISESFVGTKPIVVKLTATCDGVSKGVRVTVIPAAITAFQVLRPDVADGNSVPVRITLLAPALGDTDVSIASNVPGLVPNFTVTIPDGTQEVDASIPANLTYLKKARPVNLTATLSASAKSASVGIRPAIQSFVVDPSTVTGGETSQGIITLFEPLEYDLTVSLWSPNSLALFDSADFTIPQGMGSGNFNIYTTYRPAPKSAKIVVTYNTIVKNAYLAINP